jgi:hypothetical protein
MQNIRLRSPIRNLNFAANTHPRSKAEIVRHSEGMVLQNPSAPLHDRRNDGLCRVALRITCPDEENRFNQ